MTQPATPGEAIRNAAQRHAQSVEATRSLSREIQEQQRTTSEGTAPQTAPESQ